MPRGYWAVGKPGVEKIRKAMMDAGLPLNPRTPDVVITFGGDGTMLRANRDYPDSKILPVVYEGGNLRSLKGNGLSAFIKGNMNGHRARTG